MTTASEERYIGDGVYAAFDGEQIVLREGNKLIALDLAVVRALIKNSDEIKRLLGECP